MNSRKRIDPSLPLKISSARSSAPSATHVSRTFCFRRLSATGQTLPPPQRSVVLDLDCTRTQAPCYDHPFPARFPASLPSPANAGQYHLDIYPVACLCSALHLIIQARICNAAPHPSLAQRRGVSSTIPTTTAFQRASGCTTLFRDDIVITPNSARDPTATPVNPR